MLDGTKAAAHISGSASTPRTSDLCWATDSANWPNKSASQFVSAGGVHWHIQRFGQSGPRLFLVHGTASSSHSWGKLAPILAREFEILAVDLPGHGFSRLQQRRTKKGVPVISMDGMADQLDYLLSALQFSPDIAVGHSAGAAVIARMCLDQTIKPSKLVSLNGALLPFGSIGRFVLPAMARVLFRNPLAPWIFSRQAREASNVERLIRGTGSELSQDDLAFYVRLFQSKAHVGAALEMMANWDLPSLERDLPGLKTPVVLVAASEDLAVPAEKAADAKLLLPRSKVVYLRGLGHLAHEEAPETVAAIIQDAARPPVTHSSSY